MIRLKVSTMLLVFLFTDDQIGSKTVLRRRRDDTPFFDGIMEVVGQLTDSFVGGPKSGSVNDPFVPDSLKGGPRVVYSNASFIVAIGYCAFNRIGCDFLDCLAQNFKNSEFAKTMIQATKVMLDPDLRRAIINDPNILKIACDKGNLNDFECEGFKQFLGLFELIDPPGNHAHDEPRDKRAADPALPNNPDPALPPTAGNANVDLRLKQKIHNKEKGSSSGSSSFDYYESHGVGEGQKNNTTTGDGYVPKDCKGMKRAAEAARDSFRLSSG